MVTRELHEAGVLSGQILDHNQEPIFAIGINDALLSEAGGSWWQPPDYSSLQAVLDNALANIQSRQIIRRHRNQPGWSPILNSILHRDNWAIKDPRLCYTLPWWIKRFPSAKVLWIQRDAPPIVDSLLRRQDVPNEAYSELTTASAMELIEHYDGAAVRSVKSVGAPFLTIKYEALTSADAEQQQEAWNGIYHFVGTTPGRNSGFAPKTKTKTPAAVPIGPLPNDEPIESGPLVSVIVPNYNHAPYLDERIGSIVNQTYRNVEILLMDDCSPDNSRDVLSAWAEKDERIELKFNQTNSGSPFRQWKLGSDWAKGKYLWIAESDDLADLNMLATHVAAMENNDNAVIAYSQSQIIDGNGDDVSSWDVNYEEIFGSALRWSKRFTVSGEEEVREWMVFSNTIPNASGVLIRKSAFDATSLPDGIWKLNGDWYFYSRLLQLGDLEYFPEPRNKFRQHEETQRKRSIKSSDTFFEILKLFDLYEAEGWTDKQRLLAARRQVSEWWKLFVLHIPPNPKNVADTARLFAKFARHNPKIMTDRDLLRSIRKAVTRAVRIWLQQKPAK